jgi:hypothetical protein
VASLFPFVQLEFTHALGPDAGRYVIAPEGGVESAAPDALGSADLLLLEHVGARTASEGGLIRRKTRPAAPGEEPAPVALALATIIRATSRTTSEADAQKLLRAIDSSEEEQEKWVAAAIADLNLAIRAYRVAALDPYAIEVTRADPRRVRIGYGNGADVYKGAWSAAIAIPAPRAPKLRRGEKLAPTEAVAGVLSGRAFALDSESLIMRALLDVDQGRTRSAAVQLRAGYEMFWAEVTNESPPSSVSEPLTKLKVGEQAVTDLAERGLREPSDSPELGERVAEVCTEILSVVSTWRYELLR